MVCTAYRKKKGEGGSNFWIVEGPRIPLSAPWGAFYALGLILCP